MRRRIGEKKNKMRIIVRMRTILRRRKDEIMGMTKVQNSNNMII